MHMPGANKPQRCSVIAMDTVLVVKAGPASVRFDLSVEGTGIVGEFAALFARGSFWLDVDQATLGVDPASWENPSEPLRSSGAEHHAANYLSHRSGINVG
jgi:hypothetical protein